MVRKPRLVSRPPVWYAPSRPRENRTTCLSVPQLMKISDTQPDCTPASARKPSSKRDLLISCARELFAAEGFHATGIDRIIDHAGVAKMTLYNNFGSKDQLIADVLDGASAGLIETMRGWTAESDDPFDQIMLLFDGFGAMFEKPEGCGCLIQAAAAEYPDPESIVGQAIRRHHARVGGLLIELTTAAECRDPESLAAQIALLLGGTQCAARVQRCRAPAEEGKRAAAVLLEHACAGTDPL